MAYCDYATFKAWAKLKTDNDQVIVQASLDAAQKWIEDHTGRIFEAGSDSTRTFNLPPDLHTLEVDFDLLSVTSLVNGTGAVIDPSYYYLLPLNSPPYNVVRIYPISPVVFYPTVLGSIENCIQVTGRWAFTLTAPSSIVDATKELAKYFYRRAANEQTMMDAPVTNPDGSVLQPMKIPAVVWSLISPYIKRTS